MGCPTKCTTFRTDNINNAWLDIRDHFGPRVQILSSVYNRDINEWTIWALDNGADPVADVVKFGNWLIWRCSYGTTNMGNLPSRIRDHEGISCVPCPYDSNNYNSIRSELWLGFEPAVTNDHGNHYMKVSNDGSHWGFTCTYSGCPFMVDNGRPYFK